jgi:hypothetical protein
VVRKKIWKDLHNTTMLHNAILRYAGDFYS